MTEFDASRTGTGTKEWAEHVHNIQVGCSNGCLYCYAAHNANRFKLRDRSDWNREELTAKANIATYPARKGVIMFPSSHDITDFNVDVYIRSAKLMLAKGNRLLIVTEPRLSCTDKLIRELEEWKEQILFRFTIGTLDANVSKFWEPGAPIPAERTACLRLAYNYGFNTSVSVEPLLGGIITALDVVEAVEEHVTDTIWVGKMNGVRTCVPSEYHGEAGKIETMQSDQLMLKLYARLRSHPKIRWKDSIREVVTRYWR